MLNDHLATPSFSVPKTKITVPSELNFISWGLFSTESINLERSKVIVEVTSKATLKVYCRILSLSIPVTYILVPSGLNIIPVGVVSSVVTSYSSTNVGPAKTFEHKIVNINIITPKKIDTLLITNGICIL